MIDLIGGSGFIGTRLASRLERKGSPFTILDKVPSIRFPNAHRFGDVRDVDTLRVGLSGGPIINLAAEHRDDVRPVSLYQDVNVRGAENICRAASEKGVDKIIFTSTVAVYGFAQPGVDEDGVISPFNDYGRSKYEAEEVFRSWQLEDPNGRTLVIVRPTVVFGERNRGNVYNLLKQLASGHFVMVGKGNNVKSMAYVENVAAFLEHTQSFGPGITVYNYVDKPDFDMNTLIRTVKDEMGIAGRERIRIPYAGGMAVGYLADLAAFVTSRSLPVSSVRVRKFCATTQYSSGVAETGFVAPVPLTDGLKRTIRYEFVEGHDGGELFWTE
ncbi:MAG: NAD-dependent epimerase/dehydratase family protein [Pirellulaceae bacterium]